MSDFALDPGHNLVPYPPDGLVLGLQYWSGDEVPAMRLARLLADIEPRRRNDVTLAFCRRFDCPPSEAAAAAYEHCGQKFRVLALRSTREGVGHPDGCNALWSGMMDRLADLWAAGSLGGSSVFAIEADGVPACTDWLDRLRYEHQRALLAGKRVSGALTEGTIPSRVPHINGNLIAHLSVWPDRPSLHRTPPGEAWDLFHAVALMSEAQPTGLIKNLYGARELTPPALMAIGRETAWLSNVKDDSAITWAERMLRAPAPATS